MQRNASRRRPIILFFVPLWKNFGHFAYPLVVPLTAEYDVVFLHSSWVVYRESNFPDLTKEGVRSVGLGSLGTHSFVKALCEICPDCVVVHDKGWPQERALLHAAKHLGIPSIHIQHGIVADLGRQKTDGFILRAMSEFMKTMRTLRVYNATLLNIGFKIWVHTLFLQIRLLINPMDYCFNWRKEVIADKACIIGGRDRAYFVDKEGYGEGQLIPFGAPQFERAYAMELEEPHSKKLLFLSQPLFEDHLLDGGMEAKRRHIQRIVDASPIPVAVKPHPRESEQWYRDNFQASELHIFPSGKDINEAISECSQVVGYFSTALVNALILRRPVGIIRWVDDQSYVLHLDKDGPAMPLNDPRDLKRLAKLGGTHFGTSSYAYDKQTVVQLVFTIKLLIS